MNGICMYYLIVVVVIIKMSQLIGILTNIWAMVYLCLVYCIMLMNDILLFT